MSCHTGSDPEPPGELVLDDTALYGDLPGDYKRLVADTDADWGYAPLIANGIWRQTNASRYVRKFQSRRSLLIWKLFDGRFDGWLNSDHPSASVPGDPNTLPPGAEPNESDLDYSGSRMPPAGSPQLTAAERMLWARWIDLGAPINTGEGTSDAAFGWFLDDLRPALTVQRPRAGLDTNSDLSLIRIGMADANSGIAPGTVSLEASFEVEGRPPGQELADLLVAEAPGVWVLAALPALGGTHGCPPRGQRRGRAGEHHPRGEALQHSGDAIRRRLRER